MTISRRGSEKNHGWTEVELKSPKIAWDSQKGCIRLSQSKLKDFSTNSEHNYEISVSLEEFRKMLDIVSGEPTTVSPDVVSSALAQSLRALVRLAAVCAGVTIRTRPKI